MLVKHILMIDTSNGATVVLYLLVNSRVNVVDIMSQIHGEVEESGSVALMIIQVCRVI